MTTKILNNLTSQASYIWQIRTHCDTINNFSNWSQVDTFFTSTSLCPTPNNLTTNNITYMSAQANWDLINSAHRYKIHFRILNTNTWSNLSLVNGSVDSTNIPVLQQNTTYEWQIMAFHDSTLDRVTNYIGKIRNFTSQELKKIRVNEINIRAKKIMDIR